MAAASGCGKPGGLPASRQEPHIYGVRLMMSTDISATFTAAAAGSTELAEQLKTENAQLPAADLHRRR
ncbi:hypothetical protein [Dactylosporangium sp. NPDC048998]|uniref:hypothetical protein n=1 Tax=Dactylosporangium sp. NPDC048998 TaxID=3363976 RepID=UPI0037120720